MIRANRQNKPASRHEFVLRACTLYIIAIVAPLLSTVAIAQSPSVQIANSELSLDKIDQVFEVTSSMISGLAVDADLVLLNKTGTTFR